MQTIYMDEQKNYNGNSDKRNITEVDVEYPKNLHNLHNDLPFLPRLESQKLVCNLYKKEKYVVNIRNLKETLNHELL